MVINDSHRFAFIHIPKCGGTSVRHSLEPFNEWQCAGPPWQGEHSEIGFLDYGHIPLQTLRDHFEAEFKNIQNCWSFTVVRDPYARFPSSISQRLKMYGGGPIQDQALKDIKAEIERSIDFLAKHPRQKHHLSPDYIHFQRQIDYVRLDGEQLVDTLYTVEEVDNLLRDLSKRVRKDVQRGKPEQEAPCANATVGYRNEAVRHLFKATRPIMRLLSRTLPGTGKEYLKSFVYVHRDRRLDNLVKSDYVKDFIRDYYAEDLELWRTLQSDRAKNQEKAS